MCNVAILVLLCFQQSACCINRLICIYRGYRDGWSYQASFNYSRFSELDTESSFIDGIDGGDWQGAYRHQFFIYVPINKTGPILTYTCRVSYWS